jgi:hypothetical protein
MSLAATSCARGPESPFRTLAGRGILSAVNATLRPTSQALPNPSLEATRYGRRVLAAPGACAHLPSAAKPRLPQRSPQLER